MSFVAYTIVSDLTLSMAVGMFLTMAVMETTISSSNWYIGTADSVLA